jgi:ABC-type multidrug transport system ATPase subunit
MHTAHHIVDRCLKGKFAFGRTIILVTHHLSLCLPAASYFIELDNGHVTRQGPASEFMDDRIHIDLETPEKQDPVTDLMENEADSLGNGADLAKKSGDGKLIDKEGRHEGRISWRAYYTYIRAAGIYCWVLIFVLLVFIRGINIANQVSAIP